MFAINIAEFVSAVDGPGISTGNDQGRFILGSDMGAFDVLMRFAEPRDRPLASRGNHSFAFARPRFGRTDPSDPLTLDHDVLVGFPLKSEGVKYIGAPDNQIGGIATE